MKHLILMFVLALCAGLPTPCQSYCDWNTQTSIYCSGGGHTSLGVFPYPTTIGGLLNAEAIRVNGGPATVAGLVCRSFAPVTPFAFPLDPAAGNVLLDSQAPNVIDVSVMLQGAFPGVSWLAPSVVIPNDPGLQGLVVYTQAFLLQTDGFWQTSWCVMRTIG